MATTNIKQIQLSDGAHEIDAKYWNGHEWSDIGSPLKFIGAANVDSEGKPTTSAPTAGNYVKATVVPQGGTSTTYYISTTTSGTATEIAAEKGWVFAVASTAAEYLCTTAGLSTASAWTELGDSTNFQLVGKTLTSSGPSSNSTGSAGAQTASGSATISYMKSAEATESAGAGSSASTGNAGGATVSGSNFTFTGTAATITSTGSYQPAGTLNIAVNDHSYQPKGTISAVTANAHSHTVNAATASANVLLSGTYVEEAGAHTHSVSASGSYKPTGSVSYSGTTAAGTVSVLTGVKSDAALNGATAVTVVTGVTAAALSGDTTFVKSYPNFSGGSITGATAVTVVTGVTAASAAASTVSTDGPQYIEDVTHTAASLTGTKTFNTDAIKSIGGTKNYGFSASTTVATGISTNNYGFAASQSAIATGVKTNNYGFSQSTTALTGITTNNYGFGSSVSNVMSAPTVSTAGVLSWTTTNAATQIAASSATAGTTIALSTVAASTQIALSYATASTQDAHTGTAASTASVGISGGSIDKTVKYMKISGGTSSGTTSVVPSYTHTAASLGTATTGTVTISGGKASSTTTVVPSYTLTQMAFNTGTAADSTAIKAITGLSFTGTSGTVSVSGTAAEAGAHTHGLNEAASTITYMTSATLSTAGAINVTPTFTGTTATITHTVGTKTFTGTTATITVASDYTPAGTIGGSQTIAAHSHSYTKPSAHTHAITLTTTSVTGTAAVAVSDHTHSLGNHTHTVTTKN